MKKFLSLILTMVLSVTQITVAFGTYAQTNSESDLVGGKFPECDITWSLDIETGMLTLEGNGEMVFSGNAPWSAYKKEIKNVVVGEGITYLEGSLFYYISFDKIILPSTLEYVDSSVFHYAEFNELEIPSENNLRVLDSYSYSGLDGTEWYKNQPDGCVYMGDFLFDYKGTAPDNTTVKIKDGTRAINRNAFQSQSGIVDFEFCDSLERIGYKALDNTGWYDSKPNNSVIYAGNILYKLKGSSYYDSLTVKEGTVSIAEYAVYYKTIYNNYAYYETIYFPSSLKYIDDCAFALNDLFLEEIVFAPDSQLEYIGEKAFYKCSVLSPSFPASVKYIGRETFYGCAGEKTPSVLQLPAGVENIGYLAFHSCPVSGYSIDESNPYYTTDEQGVLFNKDKTRVLSVPNKLDAETYFVPDTVLRIEHYSFYENSSINRIVVSDSVKEIGEYCFARCEAEKIEFPYGIKKISPYSFGACPNLSLFVVPRSVEVISDMAFTNTYIYDLYIPKETVYLGTSIANNPEVVVHCYDNSTAMFYAEQEQWLVELIEEPDLSELQRLLDDYQQLDRDKYVADSLVSLDNAVENVDLITFYYCQEDVDGWIESISNAFKGLVYVPADYSEINSAKARAQAVERSLYTAESLARLDEAIASVDDTLDISNQTTVTQYAKAINEAIDNLEYLPADYTSVELAITESEKLDRRLYSQATLEMLEQSIVAVDYTLNITQQNIVDGFAKQIHNAISTLEYADVVLRNELHGVIVSATAKELDPDTALTVDLKDSSDLQSGNFAVGGTVKSVTLYDINLLLNAQKIQPDGFVTVKIKLPDGVDPKRCKVYHVIDDPVDPLVRYTTALEGNFIVFETDHFSEFAVIEVETVLSGISVTRMPDKLNYNIGERIDLSGIEITELMSDGTTKVITDYDISSVDMLSVGTKIVTIYYTHNEITKSASFEITVSSDQINANITLNGDNINEYNKKVKWYKSYSSETVKLDCNVSDNYKVEWSSDNLNVLVDSNGKVTAKGFFFAKKATITVTVKDGAGNVLASDSITVRFYKFSFQLSRIQATMVQIFKKNDIID